MQQRIDVHNEAKHLMAAANYSAAAMILEQGLRNYGSHMGILYDLGHCYTHMHDSKSVSYVVATAQTELEKCLNLMSEKNQWEALINLGKLQEAQGLVSEAIGSYTRSMLVAKALDPKDEIKSRALVLRLAVHFRETDLLEEHYRMCKVLNHENIKIDDESRHSILLAESVLVGANEEFLKRAHQSFHEVKNRNSFFFDLLNISLLSKQNGKNLLPYLETPENHTQKFLLAQVKGESFPELFDGFKAMTSTAILQALRVLVAREEGVSYRLQMMVHLRNLSETNRKLFSRKFEAVTSEKLTIDGMVVKRGQLELVLKNESEQKLLAHLIEKRALTVESAIQIIYREAWSEETFQKVKALVTRVNKKIEKILGLAKVIHLNKDIIRLD